MSHLDRFPKLTESDYRAILQPPTGRVRCVIDTDTRNEIDDQFALAWAFLSQDKLKIEGVYAAPYSFRNRLNELRTVLRLRGQEQLTDAQSALYRRYIGQIERLEDQGIDPDDDRRVDPQGVTMVDAARGMALSYDEILIVYDKLGIPINQPVLHGSDRYLESYDNPVKSDAVDHLITLARASSPADPLYIIAIGAVTNIASALLLAPDIIPNIVVTWTAGYPTTVMNTFQPSFNMEQDMLSSQLLFDCGVPLVYFPGFHVGAQLSLSLPEMETWVRGQGAIGDYLYELYTHNSHYPFQGLNDYFGRTWIIWDLVNFAWLLQPDWVPTYLIDAPYLTNDQRWERTEQPRHLIREALDLNRDAIFRDFFKKLADHHASHRS